MTHVSYPNLSTTSENGEFRLEIKGQPASDFFRDQSHFSYRLYRANSLQWEWSAEDKRREAEHLDDSPHEAWVSDEGWVVIRTHDQFFAGLLVISPKGIPVLRRFHRSLDEDKTPGFLDSEPNGYMGDSSAGPFWSRRSLAYFFQQQGRPFWSIRTWWGFRVVIDLQDATFADPAAIDSQLFVSLEVAEAVSALRENLAALEADSASRDEAGNGDRIPWAIWATIQSAAYQAGWLGSQTLVPYLRRLEQLDIIGRQTSGLVDLMTIDHLTFRHAATLSLLRLNQQPLWLPHYLFDAGSRSARKGERLEVPPRGHQWEPDKISKDLTQLETLAQLGTPDFMKRECWEYDFVSPTECLTARIHWQERKLTQWPPTDEELRRPRPPARIERIEVVEPQWRKITMRDHFLM